MWECVQSKHTRDSLSVVLGWLLSPGSCCYVQFWLIQDDSVLYRVVIVTDIVTIVADIVAIVTDIVAIDCSFAI